MKANYYRLDYLAIDWGSQLFASQLLQYLISSHLLGSVLPPFNWPTLTSSKCLSQPWAPELENSWLTVVAKGGLKTSGGFFSHFKNKYKSTNVFSNNYREKTCAETHQPVGPVNRKETEDWRTRRSKAAASNALQTLRPLPRTRAGSRTPSGIRAVYVTLCCVSSQ